jgi:hypothetical protein
VNKPELPDDVPKGDIKYVDTSEFLPNADECEELDSDFCFHISRILVETLEFLKPFESCMPKFKPHPHVEEMSRKTEFVVLDLLDKSENKSDEIIDIVQWIHENFIPHTMAIPPECLQKIVLAGDVLTNERAYSAQKAMLNGETEYEKLGGVVHRPEGIHRSMNLTLVTL